MKIIKTKFQEWAEKRAASSEVFHGTTAQMGRLIQVAGILKPRGNASSGNWSGGMFGGNPSNPDLVYVTTLKQAAIDYAREICHRSKTNAAAIITARPDWKYAIPDEDTVFEIVNTQSPTDNPLANKLWNAYARLMGFADAAEAYDFWHNPPEEVDGPSDSEIASQMKSLVSELSASLTPAEMQQLTIHAGTVAFSKPLQVINVGFVTV